MILRPSLGEVSHVYDNHGDMIRRFVFSIRVRADKLFFQIAMHDCGPKDML